MNDPKWFKKNENRIEKEMTECIIDFLDRYGIMWTWNYQHVDENGEKHFVDLDNYDYSYPEGKNGYRSSTNFKDDAFTVPLSSM